MEQAKFYKVKGTEKEYTVRELPNGEWRCDCPNFVFNWKKIGECKHIKELKIQNDHKKKAT